MTAFGAARKMLAATGMDDTRIDFISSYCDRWCERCAFTSRCSVYACEVAVGMCEDPREALELALGDPRPVDGAPESPIPDWLRDLSNDEPSAEELAEFTRREAERRARIDQSPVVAMASAYWQIVDAWMNEHESSLGAASNPVLAEALEVIRRDAIFVGAKLHRALDGRDRRQHDRDGDDDDDPVQNDWNGSAKIALISLNRSEAAWRAIAAATGNGGAAMLAEALRDLQHLVHEEFPRAMSFVRPGFDEPWR